MSHPASSRGFSLLEVVVAFVIAALALSALTGGGVSALTASATAARYQEALTRAESHLDSAAAGPLVASDRQGDEAGGFHWRVRVSPAAVATVTPGTPSVTLYDVSVQESWRTSGIGIGGRSRTVNLQTRRAAIGRNPA